MHIYLLGHMRFTPNPVFQRLELRYGTEGKGYGCWLGRGGNIQGHTAARQASQEDGDTCAEPGKGGGRVGPHVGRPLGKPRRRGVAAEDPQQGLKQVLVAAASTAAKTRDNPASASRRWITSVVRLYSDCHSALRRVGGDSLGVPWLNSGLSLLKAWV